MGRQAYCRAVLVQCEMESGRRSASEYSANSRGAVRIRKRLRPAEKGRPRPQLLKKARSFWRISFIAGRIRQRKPTGYERNIEHTRCKLSSTSSRAGGITPVHPCCGRLQGESAAFRFRIARGSLTIEDNPQRPSGTLSPCPLRTGAPPLPIQWW